MTCCLFGCWINNLAIYDAYYFDSDDDDDESFDSLVDFYIPEVFSLFNMKVTPSFIASIYRVADIEPPKPQLTDEVVLNLDDPPHKVEEGYEPNKVKQNYESLLANARWDNYLEIEEADSLISSLGINNKNKLKIKELLESFNLLNDQLLITNTCEASKAGHLYTTKFQYEADLINFLINFQISKNLKNDDYELQHHELVFHLKKIAFNTFFDTPLTTLENTQKGLTNGLSIDNFLTACSPLIVLQRQYIKYSSEYLAKCLTASYVNSLDETANTHFYQKTYNSFAENELMVSEGWWDLFSRYDQKNFFKNIAGPVIQIALDNLETIAPSNRLASYLQLLEFDFLLQKETDGDYYYQSGSYGEDWPLEDLAEFLNLPLRTDDIVDWFLSMINEKSDEERYKLIKVFESSSENSNDELLSIEFSSWEPNQEKLEILEQLDSTNNFSLSLNDFQTKLESILKSELLCKYKIN